MTKVTSTQANTKARLNMTALMERMFEEMKMSPLRVASHKIAVPFTNELGEDGYYVITVSVPKGTRDGEKYDGVAEAEDYIHRENEKVVKAEKAKAKKDAKTKK